ncbi:MAG: zf-HC2 domain-containing protein [Gemmatimonadaceae bacterium]
MTDSMIASYLDRRLGEADRERFESHIAQCTECRAAVVESEKFLKRVRPRRGTNAIIALATAAVVLVAVRFDATSRHDSQSAAASSRTSEPVIGALSVYGPTGEASSRGLRFVWSPIAGAVSYRLVVSDGSARPIWSNTGPDTAVALPTKVTLRTGESYFWIVDGLSSNGITRSTGVHEFRVGD